MNTLAINGGKPVLTQEELKQAVPQWPVPHVETEEKLLAIYRSGKW